jgi:SNF2 family DNA or RNA helicase
MTPVAVYERILKLPRIRLLLADDAGAGKTIMTGLTIREMLARRLVRRVLVVAPAGLVGNWERELRTLFSLQFKIITGADAKSGNPFTGTESNFIIVSVDSFPLLFLVFLLMTCDFDLRNSSSELLHRWFMASHPFR